MAYFMKVSAIGLAKIAAANLPGGDPVQITEIAVGDGNGNPVAEPTGAETALVHEVYRDQLTSLDVSEMDATIMVAEIVIPSDEGGFAIHEIAVFDADGDLFAYGNFPATYKPIAADGSTRDMVIQAHIKVGNASVIQLVIDTTIVLATRQWVLNIFTPAELFPGGTTHQVLRKVDNTDGNWEWADPTASLNIAVDVIREEQTASAAQDIFTLTTCTTEGVAVYVEGVRVHTFTTLNSTQLQLTAGLPAGTKVLFVQNEPNEPLNLRKMAAGKAYFMGQFV